MTICINAAQRQQITTCMVTTRAKIALGAKLNLLVNQAQEACCDKEKTVVADTQVIYGVEVEVVQHMLFKKMFDRGIRVLTQS